MTLWLGPQGLILRMHASMAWICFLEVPARCRKIEFWLRGPHAEIVATSMKCLFQNSFKTWHSLAHIRNLRENRERQYFWLSLHENTYYYFHLPHILSVSYHPPFTIRVYSFLLCLTTCCAAMCRDVSGSSISV